MARIFISHRPGDAAGYVRGLQEALAARYGRENVRTFADVARADPGAPVSRLIDQAIGEADVVLAVIGTTWLSAPDEGGRTLHDPDDRIRRELEAALERGVTLIPVPIDTNLPGREALPESLKPLLGRMAVPLSGTSFDHGLGRLLADLDRIAEAAAPPPEPVPVDVPEPSYTPPPQPPRSKPRKPDTPPLPRAIDCS